jgi:hypothetical protein
MTLPSFTKHVRTPETNGLIRTTKSGRGAHVRARPGAARPRRGLARRPAPHLGRAHRPPRRFVTDMEQGTQRLHECNSETSEPLIAFLLMAEVALGKPLRTGRHHGGQWRRPSARSRHVLEVGRRAGPNLGEGTNLRKIVVRRAESRAGLRKDGTWCDLRNRLAAADVRRHCVGQCVGPPAVVCAVSGLADDPGEASDE